MTKLPEGQGGLEADDLTPEERRMMFDERNEFRNRIREDVLNEGGEVAASTEQNLHYVLKSFLDRAENDPEMLSLMQNFLGQMSKLSHYGESTGPMPENAKNEIKSVLIGSIMAMDRQRDGNLRDKEQPQEHAKQVRNFIHMIKNRVGYIDQDTGDTHLKMRLSDRQVGDQVVYRKAK